MRKFIPLFLCTVFTIAQLSAQVRKVSGKVTNENGVPIQNATVIVKGTSTGTATNEMGTFTIEVLEKSKVLIVSSINYADAEIAVTSDKLDIILKPGKTTNLSEVVVVAYGNVKKTNLTGSIATIKAADIENKPFSSIDKGLQGSVAGLQSSSVSGAPGAATSIRIRGIGSINADANPLWVIDGAYANTLDLTQNTTSANPLSSINPDDIETITVLKDAAATAIYGSRAANGAILVTTKKGKNGRTQLNFSMEAGQNDVAFKNDKNRSANTEESRTMMRESLINAGKATNITEADALIIDPVNGYGLPANYMSTNTNWFDEVTRKGSQQQYNLSLSGGNEKTTFFISGGYFKQEGTIIASSFKRYNGSLNFTHKASERIFITAGFSGSTSVQNMPTNAGNFSNPARGALVLVPWKSPYNADGTLRYIDAEGQFPITGNAYNPLVEAALNKNSAKQTALRGNVSAEAKIFTDLKFTSRYAGEYFDVSEDQYLNPFYGDGNGTSGFALSGYTRLFNYTFSNFLDYKKSLGKSDDVYFDVKAGYEASATKNYRLLAAGSSLPANLDLQYLASAATPTTASTVPTERANTSIFSVADFNYKNRYVLSGSFRRDGSSVFGRNHLYGNFYSVGATWNISEENFVQNMSFISLLKLRTSYGSTGNSAIGNTNGFGYYTSLATYGYGRNYTGLPGSYPLNVGNIDLTWEKNKQFNIGLDFGFFKSRLYGTVDYYNRRSDGLLANVPLSLTSGFIGQNQNIGLVENKGIELTIGGKPVALKNFTWDVSFNFARNHNEVISLYNHVAVPSGQFNYTEGNNLQAYFLRAWAGVDPANGKPLWYTDGSHQATTSVVNNAAIVLDNTKTAMPKYFGSFTNTFTYKGISLTAQLFYNFGNYIYDSWGSYYNSEGVYLGSRNQMTRQLNAWKKPGDITDIPAIVKGGNNNSYRASTRYLYKGDYIRLRNVQLAYVIPQNIIKKARINTLSIYVRGTNLLTFDTDQYLPFDPENGINSTNNMDVYAAKSITAGIKIGL